VAERPSRNRSDRGGVRWQPTWQPGSTGATQCRAFRGDMIARGRAQAELTAELGASSRPSSGRAHGRARGELTAELGASSRPSSEASSRASLGRAHGELTAELGASSRPSSGDTAAARRTRVVAASRSGETGLGGDSAAAGLGRHCGHCGTRPTLRRAALTGMPRQGFS